MSSIATKRGDKGKTSLLSGERVSKADPQVEAYGVIDELNSWLGLARVKSDYSDIKEIIYKIQKDLFILAGELASRQKEAKDKIEQSHLEYLESNLECYQAEFNFKGFTVPGQSELGSYLDISRTICRRAERRIAAAEEENNITFSKLVHKYVNRLSDLIYILSRTADKRELVSAVTKEVLKAIESEEN